MPTTKFLKQPIIPRLIYTSKAYATLQLMMGTDHARATEFGFLGLVQPVESDYLVLDFKLIPQEGCTSTYWESDDEKYPEWVAKNIPIQSRKYLRLHGHSHVNMHTSPSGVDNVQINLMSNSVSDYFIQFICNHQMVNTINLWNKEANLIFENIEQYVKIADYYVKIDSKTNLTFDAGRLNVENGVYIATNNTLKINNSISLNFTDLSVIINDEYLTYSKPKGIQLTAKADEMKKEIEAQFKKYIKKQTIYFSTTPNYPKKGYNYYDEYLYGDYPSEEEEYTGLTKKQLDKENKERQKKLDNFTEFGYYGVLTTKEKQHLRKFKVYGDKAVRDAIKALEVASVLPKGGTKNESK